MEKLKSLPAADGFYMPGEFEPHWGCIMIWPKRPGSWPFGAGKAREAFARIAEAIADSEQVIMLAEADVKENAREMLSDRIQVVVMESDDAGQEMWGQPLWSIRNGKSGGSTGGSMPGEEPLTGCILSGKRMTFLPGVSVSGSAIQFMMPGILS